MRNTILETRAIQFRNAMEEAQAGLMDGRQDKRYRNLRRAKRILDNMAEDFAKVRSVIDRETEEAKKAFLASDDYNPYDWEQHDLWDKEQVEAFEESWKDSMEKGEANA